MKPASILSSFNALQPSLEIRKLDSVTGDPVKGAKFQIWYGTWIFLPADYPHWTDIFPQ